MERVMNLARKMAAKSPAAIPLATGARNAIEDMSRRHGYRHEQDLRAQRSEHPDAKEAVAACPEKRKPAFRAGGAEQPHRRQFEAADPRVSKVPHPRA
jgi:enoyl-CoA hydratase